MNGAQTVRLFIEGVIYYPTQKDSKGCILATHLRFVQICVYCVKGPPKSQDKYFMIIASMDPQTSSYHIDQISHEISPWHTLKKVTYLDDGWWNLILWYPAPFYSYLTIAARFAFQPDVLGGSGAAAARSLQAGRGQNQVLQPGEGRLQDGCFNYLGHGAPVNRVV